MKMRPPRMVAPAELPPLPCTAIEPDIRFSPTLQPQLPLTTISAPSHMPPQYQPTGPSKTMRVGDITATARQWRAAGLRQAHIRHAVGGRALDRLVDLARGVLRAVDLGDQRSHQRTSPAPSSRGFRSVESATRRSAISSDAISTFSSSSAKISGFRAKRSRATPMPCGVEIR